MIPHSPEGLRTKPTFLERFMKGMLASCAGLSILTTAGIVVVLVYESVALLQEVPFWRFLADTQWTPLFAEKHFGIWPLVCGTFLTTAIALFVAVPLGLLAATFLSEFAAERSRRIVKPVMELLAGIPTIVYGYFALTFVTPVLQNVIPGLASFNALSPGIVMGIMIFPIIASLSEDSLYAVPASLREAALALGASRLATVLRVVIPTAFSGVTAAVVLGFSRAIGETMIVAIAAGQQPRFTLDPRVPIETMTAYIVQVSLGDTPTGTLEYRTIFAVGLLLFLFTLAMNLVGIRLRRQIVPGTL
jgi:phosphate transport system permease protein